MLMRKPPQVPVGVSAGPDGVELLIRVGRAWGVERFVGWRWWVWRARRRLRGIGRRA